MKNHVLILFLIVATFFACSSDSLTDNDSNRSAVERPIKIKNLNGDFSFFPGDGESCSELTLNALGEGTVSHLGLSTFFEEWCWDGTPPDLGIRSLKITAANGDELWGTHNFILWTSDTTFEETLVFDGGTGRFENASGEFSQSVEITLDSPFSGTFVLNGTGSLTY